RLRREDRLQGQREERGDRECQVEAGVVLAALDVADRLVVDPERIGDVLARQPPLGAEDRDPVVDRGRRPAGHASRGAGAAGRGSSASGARSGSVQASIAEGRIGRYSASEIPTGPMTSIPIVTGPTNEVTRARIATTATTTTDRKP